MKYLTGRINQSVMEDKWAIVDHDNAIVGDVAYDDYDKVWKIFDFMISHPLIYYGEYRIVCVKIMTTAITQIFEEEEEDYEN